MRWLFKIDEFDMGSQIIGNHSQCQVFGQYVEKETIMNMH